jgi:large subunit ribosomal protein L9
MAREVILLADVEGLGVEGEIVRVAEGYARNYLVPRSKAAAVTPATKRLVEKKKQERIAREAADREAAQAQAGELAKASVTLTVKTGENGKLFGSVTAADVLAELEKQGIRLDKKQLELAAPIRELGVFDVRVTLQKDVEATLKVWVVEE